MRAAMHPAKILLVLFPSTVLILFFLFFSSTFSFLKEVNIYYCHSAT